MSVRQWQAVVGKETRLIGRDLHALALLFAMPLAFLLVMSLAMQDQFAARAGRKLGVAVVDQDKSASSAAFVQALKASGSVEVIASDAADAAQLKNEVRGNRRAFGVLIANGYGTALGDAKASLTDHLSVLVAADTAKQTELIFLGTVREILARERLNSLFAPFNALIRAQGGDLVVDTELARPDVQYLYGAASITRSPSAVQQSAPAWLVFGAFFIVIPLSNTLIRERQQGTARRLKTLPIGAGTLLAGKLAPYFIVNLVQVVVMLITARFLVPALGGEALELNGSPWALLAVAMALSLAAIGYALLIATVARTTEQATLLGGAGNLILAAIGGIMVPKFVMPEAMQQLTNISPMAWGLDGFLDVLLRDGTWRDVSGEVFALGAFGIATFALAWWAQARQMR